MDKQNKCNIDSWVSWHNPIRLRLHTNNSNLTTRSVAGSLCEFETY